LKFKIERLRLFFFVEHTVFNNLENQS